MTRGLMGVALLLLLLSSLSWAGTRPDPTFASVSWNHVTTYATGEPITAEDLPLRRYRVFMGKSPTTMKKVAENLTDNRATIPQLKPGAFLAVSCYLAGVPKSEGPRSVVLRYGTPGQVTGVQ